MIYAFLILTALCAILFLTSCIKGRRDETSDQISRAIAEGNGLHPPFRQCSSACCRGRHREAR